MFLFANEITLASKKKISKEHVANTVKKNLWVPNVLYIGAEDASGGKGVSDCVTRLVTGLKGNVSSSASQESPSE
jgi:hypothetical protein